MSIETIVVLIFCLGYTAIAIEHKININKTASALLTAVLCWTVFAMADPPDRVLTSATYKEFLEHATGHSMDGLFRGFVMSELSHHLATISEILFFLLGAMTIVELIDAHHGFRAITDRIKTRDPRVLLWIICWITFFLSSILDNLTTHKMPNPPSIPIYGGRCVYVLKTGTDISAAIPRNRILLPLPTDVSDERVPWCLEIASAFNVTVRYRSGASIQTRLGMNSVFMMFTVVICPPIQSMVVVTSPIGVHAPPAFAAITIIPAKNNRS